MVVRNMAVFGWSRTPPARTTRRLAPDRPLYVISDLHLGDGTRSDTFMAKDRHLLALIDQIRAEDGNLVVAGDAIDFAQGWTFARILRAHGAVLRALSEMADRGRMVYIYGNHDHDIQLFQYVLRFPVVSAVEVGEPADLGGAQLKILHGYEYDRVIGPDLRGSEVNTMVHHALERFLGTWLRPPLHLFYNRTNRFAFWLLHKVVWATRASNRLRHLVGMRQAGEAAEAELAYWLRSQLGDPGDMLRPALRALEAGPHRALVCGHSHLPGLVTLPSGRVYANTGSWTFDSATVLRWDRGLMCVRDWISGKVYDDHLYRPALDGAFDHLDFDDWWRDEYMGWLRFRCGEERGRRRPPWLARPEPGPESGPEPGPSGVEALDPPAPLTGPTLTEAAREAAGG